jgi:hypothetical protein
MKLEAKQRLQLTAAKGDAVHLRKALIDTADLFANAVDAVLSNSAKDAVTNLKQAMKLVAAGAKKTFGKAVVYIEPTLEKEINAKKELSMFGGVQVNLRAPDGEEFNFSWEFNLLESNQNQVAVWVGLEDGDYSTPHFEYKFNIRNGGYINKYENMVNNAMNYFEQEGFKSLKGE